ncbi:uncharacterized protein SPAPADRAFT_57283 [Spathaspora passalidarum NRRL Y-27907]|uniref:Uncharacterized protein n=1 Tax=Spathaspora passalidarum (strain NRRL Y-27907 / 11-Y1) TaxID=619300 RepID=G3AUF2_SPAPN|nr:uncharacterized protein SPAPADRAFT_57283 [Spathaspora passalidarum NRRL Y-27907]EGW30529.1 hypothetical protein SPAPADRAFT_57283 [Spathaspora passalidarum NRRL Y-27907]
MYKPKFQFRPNTTGLIINKPTIDLTKVRNQIVQIPTFKRKLLYLYKQFYKLCDFQYHEQHDNINKYQTLLRRNFSHISFNNRRNVILSTTEDLNEKELVERMLNTLAFVFNATVARDDPHIFDEIHNHDDLKKTNIENMEANILNTILRMDSTKPDVIKYDFQYNWWGRFRNDVKKVQDWEKVTRKQLRSMNLEWMTFYQHETTVMRLNENLKLCL